MFNTIDQIQERWQRVEADRAPQKRRDRSPYQKSAGSRSGKPHPQESDEMRDGSHLDLTA